MATEENHLTTTQRDVAIRAGVAPKTVSNVLHNHPYVREEVRRRVLAAMNELGYRPNRAAQNFRTGRSRIITLAVPELSVEYFADLAQVVESYASQLGYTVLISQTRGLQASEIAALDGFDKHVADGILFSPVALDPKLIAQRSDSAPLVVIGEQVGVDGIDHVGIDNIEAARQATRHLLDQGRRNPLFLGSPAGLPTYMADLRFRGFQKALSELGIAAAEDRCGPPVQGYVRKSGYLAMKTLLAENHFRYDALLCANDLVAEGAIRALWEAGVQTPDDVAIIGFDDIEEASFSRPSLSSVAQDKNEIARQAIDLLIQRIDGDTSSPRDVITPFEIVERESSRCQNPAGPDTPALTTFARHER